VTVAHFDASALVKLLVDEEGDRDARELWWGADAVFSNRLASVEVRAALAAGRRADRLGGRAHATAIERWDSLRASVRDVELTREIEHEAGRLPSRHALSGADAIHLASALVLSEVRLVVATWDARLGAAARAEGLATMPRG
jgi:predicted nucleic acid-binding protein